MEERKGLVALYGAVAHHVLYRRKMLRSRALGFLCSPSRGLSAMPPEVARTLLNRKSRSLPPPSRIFKGGFAAPAQGALSHSLFLTLSKQKKKKREEEERNKVDKRGRRQVSRCFACARVEEPEGTGNESCHSHRPFYFFCLSFLVVVYYFPRFADWSSS